MIKNFDIKELVCPHVAKKHSETAWAWMDPRLKTFLEWFRQEIDREVYVNSWDSGGKLSQRGLRCNMCSLVKEKKVTYNSAHIRFQAIDFNVKYMTDEEVIKWLIERKNDIPVNIRIEFGTVGWIHIDVCNNTTDKIQFFKA